MYTYKIMQSENAKTYGNGNVSVRIEITNTDTNETKVCDDFTYLDDDDYISVAEIMQCFNVLTYYDEKHLYDDCVANTAFAKLDFYDYCSLNN